MMTCAARYQASSFEFILNPFKFFFTDYVKKSPHSEYGQASLVGAVSVTYNLGPLATIEARINAAGPGCANCATAHCKAHCVAKPTAYQLHIQNCTSRTAHPGAFLLRTVSHARITRCMQRTSNCVCVRASRTASTSIIRSCTSSADAATAAHETSAGPLSQRRLPHLLQHLRKLAPHALCAATHCAAP
jgi:hypothetical protein